MLSLTKCFSFSIYTDQLIHKDPNVYCTQKNLLNFMSVFCSLFVLTDSNPSQFFYLNY